MENAKGSKTGVLIVIAVIVIAAILVYAFVFRRGGERSGSAVSYAPAGQLAPGFPSDLIPSIANAQAPDVSYGIAYGASTTQSTAVFTAARPILFLGITYESWFKDNGWTITNRATPSLTELGMTAAKGSDSASVTILSLTATSSKVTVSYLAQ